MYKVTDQWEVSAGGNVFFGERPHSFFGQFANDSNVFVGVRRSF